MLRLSKDGTGETQTVQQAVDRFGQLAEIGIGHAIVGLPNVAEPAAFELVAELVAEVASISPAAS